MPTAKLKGVSLKDSTGIERVKLDGEGGGVETWDEDGVHRFRADKHGISLKDRLGVPRFADGRSGDARPCAAAVRAELPPRSRAEWREGLRGAV